MNTVICLPLALKDKHMRKHILTLAIIGLGMRTAFAGGVIGATEPTQWLNNFELIGDVAANTGTFANSVADNIKSYSLDPVASQIANNLINRAVNDTYNWMKSGFPGEGPAFIVNPDAYFKNVANQQIRIQLDSINKSNNPNKNAIAVALIKNIRADRSTVGSKLDSNLFDVLQKETCTSDNLEKIARDQLSSGLSAGVNSSLSQKDQVTQLKSKLNSEFCTSSTKNNPAAQAKLESCMQAGGCGSWGTLFAMFQPQNTQTGALALAQKEITDTSNRAVETQKSKVTNGLIPNEKCVARLQVDDEGNQYPDGEGPCTEWNVTTPVQYTMDKFTQAVTQQYGKLSNVHSFGDLLGDVASNFLQKQVEQALYSGLSKTLTSSNKNSNSLNVTYDNLLASNAKALPESLLPKTAGTTSSGNLTVALSKAESYCSNPGDKKALLSQPCNHLSSNKKTKEVDTLFEQVIKGYGALLTDLKTCSVEPGVNQKFSTSYADRKIYFDQSGYDEIQANIALYPSSALKLSNTIIAAYEKSSTEATDIILDFATYSTDSSTVIPLGQEKIDANKYTLVKRKVDSDIGSLRSDVNECQNSLCTARFRGGCPAYDTNNGNSNNDQSPGL